MGAAQQALFPKCHPCRSLCNHMSLPVVILGALSMSVEFCWFEGSDVPLFSESQRHPGTTVVGYIRGKNGGTFGYIRVHSGTFGYIRAHMPHVRASQRPMKNQ